MTVLVCRAIDRMFFMQAVYLAALCLVGIVTTSVQTASFDTEHLCLYEIIPVRALIKVC